MTIMQIDKVIREYLLSFHLGVYWGQLEQILLQSTFCLVFNIEYETMKKVSEIHISKSSEFCTWQLQQFSQIN